MKPAVPVAVAACAAIAALAWWLLRDRDAAPPSEGDAARAAPAPDAPPAQLTGAAPDPRVRAGRADPLAPEPAAEKPSARDEWRSYALRLKIVDASTGAVLRDAGQSRLMIDGARDGTESTWRIIVDAPGGYVRREDESPRFYPSSYATTLAYTHPLRPEMDVRVTVLEADGRLAVREPQLAFDLGGKAVWAGRLDLASLGVWRLRGVPFLPGETLRLQARHGTDAVAASSTAVGRETELVADPVEGISKPGWSGLVPFDRHARIEASVTLPPLGPNGEIMDAELSDHVETDNDLPTEESLGEGGVSKEEKASATVTVHRREGTPAAGALVAVGGREERTDAEGRVRFTGLDAGALEFFVRQPGMMPTSAKIDVKPGADATLELAERQPGRIDATVKDADGRPMPFARIAVAMPSHLPWLDVDGDVQRVDAYVDHLGRRALSNVEPGSVVVTARFGNRRGEATVRVVEGATTRAEIVVK